MKLAIPTAMILCLILAVLSACAVSTQQPTAVPSSSTPTPAPSREITVAAASDLAFAFQELGELFEQETGVKVIFNFGSTGQLAQQIEQGAPFDLFAAANVSFVDELALARPRPGGYESALRPGTHHTVDAQRQRGEG